jgi:5'-nucleotidase
MRILLTNDDGIHAEGLAALERIARTISDDIWIVAPETDQSGLAHSLSLSEPLRLRRVADKHYALRGTPTDCVIMGIRQVMDIKPDLVLSGINSGSNVADDVTYSGTIAVPSRVRSKASDPLPSARPIPMIAANVLSPGR